MTFDIEEVRPRDVREEVVDLFWRNRGWPFDTVEEYARLWEWRNSALSEGETRVWVARARETGTVGGHIAVYRRRYELAGRNLSVAVPGNLLVDPEHRQALLGPRLVSQVRKVIKKREYDAALTFANDEAHRMFAGMGFHEMGTFRDYTDVRSWTRVLRRRFTALAVLGPPLAMGHTILRWMLGRGRGARPSGLEVASMTPHEVRSADWSRLGAREGRFESAPSSEYLAARFLENPFATRRLYGLRDPASGALEGYVVLAFDARVTVWDCRVNPSRLDIGQALLGVRPATPEVDAVAVPVLPSSEVAADLKRRGFLDRAPTRYTGSRFWSAYWLPDHPAAEMLAEPGRWQLFYGATHH